jgi:hypothetical protein
MLRDDQLTRLLAILWRLEHFIDYDKARQRDFLHNGGFAARGITTWLNHNGSHDPCRLIDSLRSNEHGLVIEEELYEGRTVHGALIYSLVSTDAVSVLSALDRAYLIELLNDKDQQLLNEKDASDLIELLGPLVLSVEQRQMLYNALISAFPRVDDLRTMLHIQLGKNIEEFIAIKHLRVMVSTLIIWAESNGIVRDLIMAAHRGNPNNPELRAVVREVLKLKPIEL